MSKIPLGTDQEKLLYLGKLIGFDKVVPMLEDHIKDALSKTVLHVIKGSKVG